MEVRPTLDKDLDVAIFRDFYWLKEELVDFCRATGLPTSGGKEEITNRIAQYLEYGYVSTPRKKTSSKSTVDTITEETKIEANFICSEKHRAFFKENIGQSFSFNVLFQKWLKTNTGKTYREAIDAYFYILEEKKKGKSVIDKQFEYNTYIRDFFEDNAGRSLQQAILCWNYKKSLAGQNSYEPSDLIALDT